MQKQKLTQGKLLQIWTALLSQKRQLVKLYLPVGISASKEARVFARTKKVKIVTREDGGEKIKFDVLELVFGSPEDKRENN